MSRKGNYLDFELEAAFNSGDATFNMVTRKQYRRATDDSSDNAKYYDLNFDDDSTISKTRWRCTIRAKGTRIYESVAVNGVTPNGTTTDGRRKYICTVEIADDAATDLRGLKQGDDGTNSVNNVDSDLVVAQHPIRSIVRIPWDVSEQNRLEDLYQNTTNQFDRTRNGTEDTSDIVFLNSSNKAVLGLDGSNKFFGIITARDGETVTIARYFASGVTIPGSIGGLVYWDNSGNTLTATSAGNFLVGIKTASDSLSIFAEAAALDLTQGQVENKTDTTFGNVNGLRMFQALTANITGFISKFADFFGSSTTDLTVSGATNLALNTIHEYQDITIENGGVLSTAGSNGIMIIKCRNLDVQTGGTIDLQGKGGAGGASVSKNNTTGGDDQESNGNDGVTGDVTYGVNDLVTHKGTKGTGTTPNNTTADSSGGAGGSSKTAASSTSAAGTAGAATASAAIDSDQFLVNLLSVFVGSGGASGGVAIASDGAVPGTMSATSGAGGAGGAGLIILASGTVNIDGAIDCDGVAAGSSSTTIGAINTQATAAGGSGGGASGGIIILHVGAFTGTETNATIAGGALSAGSSKTFGGGTSNNSNGTAGGAGFRIIQRQPL
jgi:hypothetical protein